jgi:hypothetical protein
MTGKALFFAEAPNSKLKVDHIPCKCMTPERFLFFVKKSETMLGVIPKVPMEYLLSTDN